MIVRQATGVDEEMPDRYIGYLYEIEFGPRPLKAGVKSLPEVEIDAEQKKVLEKVDDGGAFLS